MPFTTDREPLGAMPVLVVHGDAVASAPVEHAGRRYTTLARGARLSGHPRRPRAIDATHAERVTGEIVEFPDQQHGRPARRTT